ncbi:hypothetical protein GGI20_001149 [Coemansia sp. BCRC 34301]|nr:hypothetical protein GGI20_001149 [Coemansia sp. BCRC 34301]
MALSMHSADAGHSSDWAFKRLFKLESECRSPTLAAQVQAVGQFPKLFDQFPFPTLVGSALLKLGDLFCSSPNALRYHIAQVFAASQHHLPHTAYTEELLRRVLVVLYSNDPIARVLALRLIGNASVVFAKFPEAQHGVLLRYQSTHPLEVAAAVHTTESLLAYSPEFLGVVWETVIAKASDINVLDSVRAQLIRSLRHAAPNLQLSTLLYSHCSFWVDQPGSTIAVKEAALATWKAVIQPHNELKQTDAERISHFILHELGCMRRVALALLGLWRPKVNNATAVTAATIKDHLVKYIESQLQPLTSSSDIHCIRPAVVSLAYIEASTGTQDIPKSWSFSRSLAKGAIDAFDGPATFKDTAMPKCGLPANPLLVSLVQGTMLVVNVASVLRQPELLLSAATAVASAWRAIACKSGHASDRRYVKRFLEKTWIWCNKSGTGSVLATALDSMLEMTNCHVFDAVVAIALKGRLGDSLIRQCSQSIEDFVLENLPDDLQGCARNAKWNSIVILLACTSGGPSTSPINAVTKWCTSAIAQECTVEDRDLFYSRSGPPAHVCQTLLYLLAARGCWSALGLLIKAIPTHRLGSEVQEWFDAMSLLAEAECSLDDTERSLSLADSSLSILHVLDNQQPRHRFQIFVVQFRKELVGLLNDCKRAGATQHAHPSAVLMAKLQAEGTQELIAQANFVLDSFLCIDSIMRRWLEDVLATLNSAFMGRADAGLAPPPFTPGPSFFAMPPNPVIDIQTRPNLNSGETTVVAASGSQLHVIVEGFMQLSKRKLSVSLRRVRVAIWLSQRPKQGSDRDLLCSSNYNLVAQSARARRTDDSAFDSSSCDNCWDVALTFDAVLDGNYFACPCTVSMPQVGAAYNHHDATVSAHIHIACALVDSSDRAWWVGPHSSYLLTISTTAK